MEDFNQLISDLILELNQLESFKQCATYNRELMPDGPSMKAAILKLAGCTIEDKAFIKEATELMVKAHDAYGYSCEGGCPAHVIKDKLLKLLDD